MTKLGKRAANLYLLFLVLWFSLVGFGVVGYVMNIVALVSAVTHNAPTTTMFIGRIVGVFFAPLGAILGWF